MKSIQLFLLTSLLVLFFAFLNSCRPMEEKTKVTDGIPIDCTYSLPNLAQINKFILANPTDAKLFRIRSQILLDSGRYKEALSDAKRALSMSPDDAYNFVVVAKAHRALGQIDSAMSACFTAEKAGFNDADNYLLMGDLFLIVKQYPQSLDNLNKALKLAPFEPRIYYLKGVVFWETNDTTKAISNWQTAVEQDPTYADGYIRLANYYMSIKQYNTAEQYLRSGLRLKPNDPFLNMNMGIYLTYKGFADSATQAYKTALTFNTDLSLAKANLGLLLCDKGQYEEAKPLLEQALPSDPKNTILILRLAQCYQNSGELEKAKVEFNKIIQLDRDYVKEAAKGLEKIQKRISSQKQDSIRH